MLYDLPDPGWATRQKRWEVPDVVIMPEKGESLVGLAVKIAWASIELAPPAQGVGLLDPHVGKTPTVDDREFLFAQARETHRIDLDYCMGRPVKLHLKILEDRIKISLNGWANRWDTNETNTIPEHAVTELGEVLARAALK